MGKPTRDPGAKELRSFALVTGAMVAAVFGLLLPWLFASRMPLWPWIVFAFLSTWGLVHPVSRQPMTWEAPPPADLAALIEQLRAMRAPARR